MASMRMHLSWLPPCLLAVTLISVSQSAPTTCGSKLCVPKCCQEDQVFFQRENRVKCIPQSDTKYVGAWAPALYRVPSDSHLFGGTIFHEARLPPSQYSIFTGWPTCEGRRIPMTSEEATIRLLENGSLFLHVDNLSDVLDFGEFCVDRALIGQELMDVVLLCNHLVTRVTVEAGLSLSLALSCVALVIIVVVYLIIPEGKNFHGLTILCYISSTSISYVWLLVSRIAAGRLSPSFCVAIAILKHFFALVAFFWLNVIGLDVYRTLKGFRVSQRHIRPRNILQSWKFIRYCCYAFGIPFLIVLSTVTVNFASDRDSLGTLHPRYGTGTLCWFGESVPVALYFYVPVGLILAVNTALFVLTTLHLRSHARDTARLQKCGKQRFSLYIKLFFVMGITWVAEVISWAWGQNDFWYIVDYINALQGVFMFVIFVCKRKTLMYLSRILRGQNPSSGFDYSTSAHDTKSTSLSRPSERGSGGCCLAPAESSEPEGEAGEKECNGGNPPKAPPRRRSSSCCYDEIGEDSRPWEVVLLDGEVRAGRRRHQSERGLCCRETEGSDSPEASLDSPIRESPGVSQGQLMTEASKRRKEFSSGRRKTVSFEDEPCDDNKMALHLASQKIRGTLV